MTTRRNIGSKIGKYTITRYISSGGFGDVYEVLYDNKIFAVKVPSSDIKKNGLDHLTEEYNIIQELSNRDIGIMNVKLIKDNDSKAMVMDLLGPSLYDLKKQYKIDLKSLLLITIQSIKILEHIHNKGFVHRDIKTCNLVVNPYNPNQIFCIDFGLTTRWKKNGTHVKKDTIKGFCGTEKYASSNAHKYIIQSRRDDLESLSYTLANLYKDIKWNASKIKDKKERLKELGNEKEKCTGTELFTQLPMEFAKLYDYTKTLEFTDKPSYSKLINMFERRYKLNNYTDRNIQWTQV